MLESDKEMWAKEAYQAQKRASEYYSKLNTIIDLVNTFPNDQELGREVRNLITAIHG